jgi:murein DD-endopeptidase MepM/ murein hydrolase activator NlpD
MKLMARIVAVTALLVFQQTLAPLAGWAQVDPCTPVPIPGLCGTPGAPSPSPRPSPSPSPSGSPGGGTQPGGGGSGTTEPVGGGGTGGGNKSKGGQKGGGGQEKGDGVTKQGGKGKKGEGSKVVVPKKPPKPTGPFVVSAPNNTSRLVELLTPLQEYNISLNEALIAVSPPFPVMGLSYWTDDWHACRDGCTRYHEGLDMFARPGTPLVAMADGFVSQKYVGDLPGISIEITDAQGIQYFYAHLSAWAPGIQIGDQVRMGQVIGYVGNTGNAIYTPPHVHLEFQPNGIPHPPKPVVDRYLEIAEANAERYVAQVTGSPPPAEGVAVESSSFRLTRLFDLAGGGEATSAEAQRLLAVPGIQPSVSSLEVARSALQQMAYEIYWGGQADVQLGTLAQQATQLVGQQDLAGASPWAPLGATTGTVSGTATGVLETGD